jgi:hypothetical protein
VTRGHTVTLVHGGERVELSAEQVDAVVDYLWKGLVPGAVVAAATLAGANGREELEAYEWQPVRAALAALGISER